MNQIYFTRKQCYLRLTHTHTRGHARPLPGWLACSLPVGREEMQWEWRLCLCGGVRLGETKRAHSSEPPASRPSILLSRRERWLRNVSQACREMDTCSQRLGTCTWCNKLLILLSHCATWGFQDGKAAHVTDSLILRRDLKKVNVKKRLVLSYITHTQRLSTIYPYQSQSLSHLTDFPFLSSVLDCR